MELPPPDDLPEDLVRPLDLAAQAVREIARFFDVCPVCLTFALGETVDAALAAGLICHRSDEPEEAVPTHDAPRAKQ